MRSYTLHGVGPGRRMAVAGMLVSSLAHFAKWIRDLLTMKSYPPGVYPRCDDKSCWRVAPFERKGHHYC